MQRTSAAWAGRGQEAPALSSSVPSSVALGQEPRGLGAILGLALLVCKMAGRLISSSETGERNS